MCTTMHAVRVPPTIGWKAVEHTADIHAPVAGEPIPETAQRMSLAPLVTVFVAADEQCVVIIAERDIATVAITIAGIPVLGGTIRAGKTRYVKRVVPEPIPQLAFGDRYSPHVWFI